MILNWLIGIMSNSQSHDAAKIYPVVFSIHESEIYEFLDWMRNHECPYSKNNKTRQVLNQYTNREIVENKLVSMVFEQYSNDGSKCEGDISIALVPGASGTKYSLSCKCGEVFEPSGKENLSRATA